MLRQWEFSETSQTVLLLCRAHGVLRGLAKGAHRDRAPFSGGFEVMTRGEVVAMTKGSSELATLIEWDLQEVFWGPRSNWRAHQSGLYVVDVLRHMLIDADPHPALFDKAIEILRHLDGEGFAPVVAFQWSVLLETGYDPRLELEGETGPLQAALYGFNPQEGGLVADPGSNGSGHTWRVRRGTVEVLRTVREHGDVGSQSADQVMRAARLLGHYLSSVRGQDFALGEGLFQSHGSSRGTGASAVP